MNVKVLLFPLAAVVGLFGLAACGAGGSTPEPASSSAPAAHQAQAAGAQPADASFTVYIFRGAQKVLGPDGNGHDAVVPSSWVLHVGQTAHFTVINYDEGPHSITAPDLGLNQLINPGNEVGDDVQPVTTTFSFTPTKAGVFRWHCVPPCDAGHGGWAMTSGFGGADQEGFMAGNFVVLA